MNSSIKLAVLNLTGGGISGGHRKYLVNMLPRLAACEKLSHILCASPGEMAAKSWLPALPKVTYIDCRPFRFPRRRLDAELEKALAAFAPDVVLSTMEKGVDYAPAPIVTLVQNMAPMVGARTGDGVIEKLKSLARRRETVLAVRKAAHVVVATKFVADFLIERLGVSRAKVSLVSFGHNPPMGAAVAPAPLAGGRAGRFIFTVGSLEAYRGIEDLIEAAALLKFGANAMKLVVAGSPRKGVDGYFQRLKKLARARAVADDVVWLGNIPEPQLSWCYDRCAAFAVTSRVESFCFAALEALAHGCNCVSTDSPCLPEIFKDSALYYRAGDGPGLARALKAILDRDEAERASVSASARSRASEFSWDQTALRTIAILEDAAGVGEEHRHHGAN